MQQYTGKLSMAMVNGFIKRIRQIMKLHQFIPDSKINCIIRLEIKINQTKEQCNNTIDGASKESQLVFNLTTKFSKKLRSKSRFNYVITRLNIT